MFFSSRLFFPSHMLKHLWPIPGVNCSRGKKNVILIPICETIKNHFSYQTKILHQLHDEHIAKNCSNSNYFVKSGNIHAHRIHVLHGSCGCVLSIIPFTPNLLFNDLNCVPKCSKWDGNIYLWIHSVYSFHLQDCVGHTSKISRPGKSSTTSLSSSRFR